MSANHTDRLLEGPGQTLGNLTGRKVSIRYHSTNCITLTHQKARKSVNYAESDEDEEPLQLTNANRQGGRASKRRKIVSDASDDDFEMDEATQSALLEMGKKYDSSFAATVISSHLRDMDDFIAPDDSEEDTPKAGRRKRPAPVRHQSSKNEKRLSPPPEDVEEDDIALPGESTAQQWKFDPEYVGDDRVRQPKPAKVDSSKKQKASKTEPEARYPWLAHIQDKDRNPPDHPDYDPRTVYVPPLAWSAFSAFEKQYWEIKQNFWNTIVFFKKGKFYELYENDATIGHQLFDLKLTDRVNMRMVGVPEASLDYWANQFVAKGYKIARVDQMESALGKEMRDRDEGKKKKPGEIIKRELASVLTGGTLTDGSMLQDDMSTFCVAIKEEERDGLPSFGIAFVDTATAQFWLAEWTDDVDMTKFETFVAQTRPGELLLEKVRQIRSGFQMILS